METVVEDRVVTESMYVEDVKDVCIVNKHKENVY